MLKIIICVAILLLFVACGSNSQPEPTEPTTTAPQTEAPVVTIAEAIEISTHNEYIVALEVDPETRMIQGISRINFTNRTGKPLQDIVLRVFLNAFQQDVYPRPYPPDLVNRMHRPGDGRGYMVIEYASINNASIDFTLDATILTLHLAQTIEPDATAQILLQYHAYVPQLGHYMGGSDDAMWLGMFLPIIAVHGTNGWYTQAFYPIGTPFFLETAHYQVSITTPAHYTVVATGHRMEEIVGEGDMKMTRFAATMARDFAFAVLSPNYSSASIATESGVQISLHYVSEEVGRRAEEILETARTTFKHFENTVGIYPFVNINIVETSLLHNHASFSQMIFADGRHLMHSGLTGLSLEVGGQWFSQVVGINPVAEPWLEMGLSRFVHASIANYSPQLMSSHVEQIHRVLQEQEEMIIAQGINSYTNRSYFVATQGLKPVLMLYQLQQRIGEDVFAQLLQEYYQRFSFQIASVEDFIAMAEDAYGGSLAEFFHMWLEEGYLPDM